MNTLNEAQAFHAVICDGAIHDCGSKLGFLKANAALGAAHPEHGGAFKAFLKEIL